jgi:hypothetical protein
MSKRIIICLTLFILAGCKKGHNDPPAPGKATLVFPAQNSACTTGTVVSTNQSTVTFTWNSSENTTSYDLVIKDLLTNNTSTQSTTATSLAVTLARNNPFSWYVVSHSDATDKTGQTDPWKFYNAGDGVVTYAPFPTEITSPAYGATVTATGGTINITWKGSSISNNITGYNVYIGTTTTPSLFRANITDSFVNNVTVASNTTYYLRVVAVDSSGNFTDSGLYLFKVN